MSTKRKLTNVSSEKGTPKGKKKRQQLSSPAPERTSSSSPVCTLPRPFPTYVSPTGETEKLSSPERDVHILAKKLAGEQATQDYVVPTSPVTPARDVFNRSPGGYSCNSDTSMGGEMQSLRNQVQWLTDVVSRQGVITPMHDAISDGITQVESDNTPAIVDNNNNNGDVVIDAIQKSAGDLTSVGADDLEAQCYKGISVLEAYHKGDPVGKPVSDFLSKTVKEAFNRRMPREEREKIKIKYVAPTSVPYAKAPVINEAVRRNMSRFNKDMDDDQRRVQSDFAGAVVPILYALQDINGDGEVDKKKVSEHLAASLALIGDAVYSISCKRRDRIKPSLSKEYKELCDDKVVITSQLLGDDCDKSIKKIKETSRAPLMISSYARSYGKSSGSSHQSRGSSQSGFQRRFGDKGRGQQQSGKSTSGFQGGRQNFRRPWNNWNNKRQFRN